MARRLRSVLAVAAFVALVSLGPQLAIAQSGPDFPALTGRVVDAAGILAADVRTRLEAKLAEHEAKSTDQLVVATVPSLQELAIEDYANRLFRAWKLGQEKTNNGALLLVAPKERKLRIEVGYGLEGALTDALSKVIIATAITPKFKTGDFAGGIEAGVDGILAVLSKDADEWLRRARLREESSDADIVILIIVIGVFLTIVVLGFVANSRGGGSGARRWHRTRNGRWVALPDNSSGGWSSGGSSGWSSGSDSGGFSGGGGSSGGGGASGDW